MFVSRLISWLVLVGLFICAVFMKETGKNILLLLFTTGAFVGTYEIFNLFEQRNSYGFKKTGSLVAALSVIFVFMLPAEYDLLPVSLFVIICWARLLTGNEKKEALQKISVSQGATLLGLLPVFFLSKIYCRNQVDLSVGARLLLYMVIVTKGGDTFAYVTGMLSNKILKGKNHKIAPAISPKKSWEGTLGGLLFSVVASYCLYSCLFADNSLFLPLLAGIFLFLGGFFGDLAESALKRTCGVKDSGKLLPGMGGVYDLLDSFIFNAPLFYFLILL